ncbi:5884_t:CDS:2, partial [Cetraspora pellucida]
MEILFEIHINLDDDIFSEVKPDDLKSIARIIVDKVEEGDDYIWSTSTASHTSVQFDNVVTYYFACSQCYELEQAILKLHHDIIYEKPEDVSMPEEIEQEICANLHLDLIQICAILY